MQYLHSISKTSPPIPCCPFDIIFTPPFSDYEIHAKIQIISDRHYIYCSYKPILSCRIGKTISIYNICGSVEYCVAKIIKSDSYELICNEKKLASIKMVNNQIRVVLDGCDHSFFCNKWPYKAEVCGNGFVMVQAYNLNYVSLILGKISDDMYVIDHSKPWTGLLAFSLGVIAIIEGENYKRNNMI